MRPFLAIALMLALAGCNRNQAPAASHDASPSKSEAAPAAPQPPPPGESAAPGQVHAGTPAKAAEPPDAQMLAPGSRTSAAPDADAAPPVPPVPELREVTVPSGTSLPLELETAVASDTSQPEDRVQARLRRALVVDGVTVAPAGTPVTGVVTAAEQSGKVKGRASIAFRFTSLRVGDERYDIRTSAYAQEARATKKKDAAKIGVPAAGGAVIGGIIGGKKGAAIGGAAGGGAGTAVVLSTRGEEVRLPAGTAISVRLLAPVDVRVPLRRE